MSINRGMNKEDVLHIYHEILINHYNAICSNMDGPRDFHTAAAAAKSLQSCPTLCDPIDGSPPGSTIPEILQARIVEWVAISFSNVY